MSLPAGTRLGRYEVRTKLGKGGMGEVREGVVVDSSNYEPHGSSPPIHCLSSAPAGGSSHLPNLAQQVLVYTGAGTSPRTGNTLDG